VSIIEHNARGRQPDLSARRWLGRSSAAGLGAALPGSVSVTGRETGTQAVHHLAPGVGGRRPLRCEAAV